MPRRALATSPGPPPDRPPWQDHAASPRSDGGMRDRQLHAALRAFAEEAAWSLAAETAGGAELPFDVLEERSGRGGPALYCYRPDTAGFIADRGALLARMETWPAAIQALASRGGTDAYLRSRGHTR